MVVQKKDEKESKESNTNQENLLNTVLNDGAYSNSASVLAAESLRDLGVLVDADKEPTVRLPLNS